MADEMMKENQNPVAGTAPEKLLKKLLTRPLPRQKLAAVLKEASGRQLAEIMLDMNLLDFLRTERALYHDCETVQKLVLMDILRANAETEFGRRYGFGGMRSPEDFRSRVPVTVYGDYARDIERMTRGEENIIFPGKAVYFYRTSGTTSDYKSIPESAGEARARKAINKARRLEMYANASVRALKRIFGLYNRQTYDRTEAGIPMGAASGRTVQSVSGFLARRLAYTPLLVEALTDDALVYSVMRIAIARSDVSLILGNNAQVLLFYVRYAIQHAREIIDDIRGGTNRFPLPDNIRKAENKALAPDRKRADELQKLLDEDRFLPRYYWKNLQMASFWLGGSVGLSVEEVKPLLPPDMIFMDIGYGASEAKINIPLKPGTPYGALSVFTGFFEFLPEDGGPPKMAHELEDGAVYELLLTTYGGLYRYRINDYVRVNGFTGNTPNVCFMTKAGDIANLVQEKIPGVLLAKSVRSAAEDAGCGYVGCQVYPDRESMRYVIFIEVSHLPADREEFARKMDDCLMEQIRHYRMYRVQNRLLEPCAVQWMKSGWTDALARQYAKGNATIAQVKVPVVVNCPPADGYLPM